MISSKNFHDNKNENFFLLLFGLKDCTCLIMLPCTRKHYQAIAVLEKNSVVYYFSQFSSHISSDTTDQADRGILFKQ